MNYSAHIEALLFYISEPMTKKKIAEILEIEVDDIDAHLTELKDDLQNRGLSLVETDDQVELVTAREVHETVEKMQKKDLEREIGKAGAETLAIILYKEPITRAEIDFIRGVNSNFIIRNLLMRGLIERIPHPGDQRQFQYKITPECLSHLGITHKSELPEYRDILDQIDAYERENTGSEE